MGNGANQLSAADFDALKVKYDKNKDQALSFDETLALVEEVRVREGAPNPVPEAKVKALFSKIDSDGNGSIGFDEFKGVYFVYQSERARVKAVSKAKTPAKAPPAKKAPPPKSTPVAAKAGTPKAPPPGTASTTAAGKAKAKPKSKAPPVKRPPAGAKASGKGTPAAAKAKAGSSAAQLSPDEAATKLQASFRGAQVRKDLASKGKGKGKGTGTAKASPKGTATKGSTKGAGKATTAASASTAGAPKAKAADTGEDSPKADSSKAAAEAQEQEETATSKTVAKLQGKSTTSKMRAAATASAFGKATPKVPPKAAPKQRADQEQQVSKAVTKAQIAILHRVKRLTRAWCRTAKRLAEQRRVEQEAPEAPWASEEPWAARLAASTRLQGMNAALQSGRRPGLQDLEGEVGDQSLTAVRKTQDELDNVGRHNAEEGDVEVESAGSGESANSISGHVSRTWKPNNSSVSRYRNPRDRAVGLRQAPPLVWSAEEWERRLGSTSATGGGSGGGGRGGGAGGGGTPALNDTIRPRQDMTVGSGIGQDRRYEGINSFAGMGSLEPDTQSKAFANSKLFETDERKVLERMMADDRARRRRLAQEEEEERRNRADAQMAASDMVSRVHAGLASVPSLTPVLPVRTQAAELFEARELLQGLQSAAAAKDAAAEVAAAGKGRQGLRGGAVLPAEMFMVGRNLETSSSSFSPPPPWGGATRRGGDVDMRSYGQGAYPKTVSSVLRQHGASQEKVWL